MRRITFKKPTRLQVVALIVLGLLFTGGGMTWYQNARAAHQLALAKQQDSNGKLNEAKTTLDRISQVLVFPGTQKDIQAEAKRNQTLLDTKRKLERVKQLLKENKTSEALNILKSVETDSTTPGAQHQEVAKLKQQAQQTAKNAGGNTPAPPPQHQGSGGTSSGAGTSGGGITTPPPPGPMTAISITAFSVGASPRNASSCIVSQSLTFSVNGSGSVNVVWKVLSTKTSSSINNPVPYTFSAAGSQSDGQNVILQGLEPGDSYRVSATVVSQSNGAIVASSGPTTISNCAAPPGLLPAQQPSTMTSITPGAASSTSVPDGLFVNECSITLHAPFSVNGSGTVQAVYTITSASSGGATLYANATSSFTGSGSATDTSYIRMPRLNPGDAYTVSPRLINVGDQTVAATAGSITSGCS